MFKMLKCSVQIASIILLQFSACAFSQENMEYIRHEKAIVTEVIKNVTMTSAMKCCAVCRYTDNCVSVSYHAATSVCYLNDLNPTFHDQANVTEAEGWTSFYSTVATCEKEWYEYKGSCYLFVELVQSWPDSDEYCQDLQGHLVDIHDSEEQQFVSNTVEDVLGQYTHVWVGLNDRDEENTFVWTSGAPVTFTVFYPGRPDGGTNENCVYQEYGGYWYDYDCEYEHYTMKSVCEKGLYP